MIYTWFTGKKTIIIWPLRKIVTLYLYDRYDHMEISSGGGGGGQSLLNFPQNFQISDNPPPPPPPFALEKTVFSPLLGQNEQALYIC